MAQVDAQTILDRVSNTLRKEQDMIRKGDFVDLATLVETRERDLSGLRLSKHEVTPEITSKLSQIKRKAHLNSLLIEAAMDGVRDADRRLLEIKAAAEALGTYDRDGCKSEQPVVNPGLQKRA